MCRTCDGEEFWDNDEHENDDFDEDDYDEDGDDGDRENDDSFFEGQEELIELGGNHSDDDSENYQDYSGSEFSDY